MGLTIGKNWRRATFDLVLGPWHWPTFEHRRFRIFQDGGPTEHRFTIWLGPLHATLWPKTLDRSRHVCDVADCERGFATIREVVEHERTHRVPLIGRTEDPA